MDHSLRRLYEDLRSIAVAVVYPPGEDRDLLVEQLKRIGCRIHLHWPFPDCPPGADVVFFLVSQCGQNNAAWSSSEADATLIALSDYETPTTLKQLLKTNAHGVLTRPFRSAGILSTLVLARSAKLFQNRQQNKIDKLEGTIKARRVIEKAIRALMDNQRVDEREAYEHMRSRATRLRVSVAEVAAMIVEASEAMEKLGLGGASRARTGHGRKPGRPHMKVLIARMNHETNTFSPVPTPLSAFGNDGPTYDAAAYEENKGKRTAMSAFIDLAEAHGAGLVTPVSATAYPAGGWTARPTGNYATASSPPRPAATRCCWICMAPWRSRPPTTARATCWNSCAGPRRACRWPWRWTCTATSRRRWWTTPTSSSASRPIPTSTCTKPASTPAASCSTGWRADRARRWPGAACR